MSLTYDPNAIRYASTQEAYGCTWTLNKIESDGAQVWKNAKGHEALVPKVESQVRQSMSPTGRTINYSPELQQQPYSIKGVRFGVGETIDFSSEPVLEIKFDGTEKLTVSGEVSAYFPISQDMREQWVNGTWENLEPNSYDDHINVAILAKRLGLPIPNDYFCPPPVSGSQPPPLERVLGTPEKPAPDPRRSRMIQSIGVDVSNSPPRTALIVAEKMVNGAIMIHDEMVVDTALTNEQIQELAKSLLNRAGAQRFEVSVDRPNKSNSKRVPRRHEIGDQKLAADGTTLTWDGLKWRNPVQKHTSFPSNSKTYMGDGHNSLLSGDMCTNAKGDSIMWDGMKWTSPYRSSVVHDSSNKPQEGDKRVSKDGSKEWVFDGLWQRIR
jgi:hypothetical protein